MLNTRKTQLKQLYSELLNFDIDALLNCIKPAESTVNLLCPGSDDTIDIDRFLKCAYGIARPGESNEEVFRKTILVMMQNRRTRKDDYRSAKNLVLVIIASRLRGNKLNTLTKYLVESHSNPRDPSLEELTTIGITRNTIMNFKNYYAKERFLSNCRFIVSILRMSNSDFFNLLTNYNENTPENGEGVID